MRSTFTALAIAGATLACSERAIRIDVPFESIDRSAVIAVEEGGTLEVFAVGDAERMSMPVLKRFEDFEPKEGLTITVLLYRMSLSEHDLRPGPVARASEGSTRNLPSEDRIVQGKLLPSGELAWTQLGAVPEPLASFKIPGAEDPCLTLDGKLFSLGGERFIDAAVQVDEDTAWVIASTDAFSASHYYEVSKTGATLIETPAELSELSVFAAARDRTGRVWISGGHTTDMAPQTYSGSPGGSWSRVVGRSGEFRRDISRWLQPGSPDEHPSTMYSLTQRGDLERYSEGSWAILNRESSSALSAVGAIGVVGADEVYFVFPGGGALFEWDGSDIVQQRTEIDQDLGSTRDFLRTVAVIPGLGEFAGSDNGVILRRQAGGWNIAGNTPLVDHDIRAFAPFRDGMLVTGRWGFVYQFNRDTGLCVDGAANLGGDATLETIVPLQNGWVVAGTVDRNAGGEEANAGFVEIRQ